MEKLESISELNKSLCLYIKSKFFSPYKVNGEETSLNKYAKACNLSSSTISKINDPDGYNIPVSTIYVITEFENTDLETFFSDFTDQLKKGNLKTIE